MVRPRMGIAGAALLAATVALASVALAQGPAPDQGPAAAGRWKTIDDKTGEPRSIVVIEEKNGVFEGRIEKIFFRPDEPVTDPVCSKCTDARKGQKIIGLTFLTGLTRDGLDYAGGEILDPANGKVYRAKLKLSADGAKLEVRGYIGISLFGRSQTWLRE